MTASDEARPGFAAGTGSKIDHQGDGVTAYVTSLRRRREASKRLPRRDRLDPPPGEASNVIADPGESI